MWTQALQTNRQAEQPWKINLDRLVLKCILCLKMPEFFKGPLLSFPIVPNQRCSLTLSLHVFHSPNAPSIFFRNLRRNITSADLLTAMLHSSAFLAKWGKVLLLSEVTHYLDLAGWAPESLLFSVAKNVGSEGLITKASNPDSGLQKYGEIQQKSWKWFATLCSNQSPE